MTRKDYIIIAAVFKARVDAINQAESLTCRSSRLQEVSECIEHMAHALRQDNSRFDYARFVLACGIKETA